MASRPLGGRGGRKPGTGRGGSRDQSSSREGGAKGQPGRRSGGAPRSSEDRSGAPRSSGRRGPAGDRRQGRGRSDAFSTPSGGPEVQRPRAPAEKRRAAGAAAKRSAKQARRRDQYDAARQALRPGPDEELIEGRRPVIEALRSGRHVTRVLVAGGGRGTVTELVGLAEQRGVPVETVPRSLLDATAETGAHQGVLAVVAPIEPIELDELLAIPLAGPEPPFYLACDGIEDPRNLGALARSAAAAGCHGMIVPRHRSAPLSAVAVKASAGALQHLPVAEVPNLARAVERLCASGVWCIGLDEDAETGLFAIDLADEPVCVVVGGEGAGLHRLVREACDLVVAIPMAGRVASLNASVAGALALFEVRRRRGAAPISLAHPAPSR
jgi:23S rRNA (guanosine2251-2'-O)-methyltransferase